MRRGLLWFIAAMGFLTLTVGSDGRAADAQEEPVGQLQLDIRYPNGALATDARICVQGHSAVLGFEEAFFYGSSDAPIRPDALLTLPANTGFALKFTPCQGSGPSFGGTWHFGQAAGSRAYSYDLKLLDANALVLAPGETRTLPVTIGGAVFSGAVLGEEFQRCQISAFGVSAWGDGLADYVGWVDVDEDSSEFTVVVEPGRYELRLDCWGPRLNYVWPPSGAGFVASHGDVTTDINLDIRGLGDDDGSFLHVAIEEADAKVPFCLDAFDLDGEMIREGSPTEARSSVWVPKGDQVRLRLRDCLRLGFGDSWYPSAASPAGAEVLTSPGFEVFDVWLPAVNLAPDDLLTCNGLPATGFGNGLGGNSIVGSGQADAILSFGGADVIRGLTGDDTICSGGGADRVFGNAGDDWINAGAGDDWVGAGWGDDTVFGGSGNDFIRGFKHDDTIDGGPGHDRLTGGWGNDVLIGNDGNDTLRAYYGADELYGGRGNDALVAGNGPDLLVGGWGTGDRLFGEQGRDTCLDAAAETLSGCWWINGERMG